VGLELQLLPIVKTDGRIYLEACPILRAVNSEKGIKTAYGFVPGFDELSSRIAVELKSGETALIRLEGSPEARPQGQRPEFQTTLVLITPKTVDQPIACAPTPPPAVEERPFPPQRVKPLRPAESGHAGIMPPYGPPPEVIPPPVVSAPTLAAPVVETPTPGRGLVVVQVSMDKDGMVVCQFAKRSTYEPVTNNEPGLKFPVTSFVRRTVQEERVFRQAQLRIIGTDGKPVDAKELTARLAKETSAVFVLDGGYDPKLLSLLKEGTLIISPAPNVSPNVPSPAATKY
jgi:hypothetical protein